jgi:hypothetical protein
MMNNKKSETILLLVSSLLCLAFLPGCVSRESTVYREVSESGKDWSQTQLTQEYKGPRGEKIRDKQFVKEKIQCISKKTGQEMTVDSEEECFKRGGKVVDEIITEESTSVRK